MRKERLIEDENGVKQRVVSIGRVYVGEKCFDTGHVLKNNKKMSLLEDDIILASCPKTGKYHKIRLQNLVT